MGAVAEDQKILGDIYRLLWKRDVNTYAGCEEAAAAISCLLHERGLLHSDVLWDEDPKLFELQNVLYPFKTTKMAVIDEGLLRTARTLFKVASSNLKTRDSLRKAIFSVASAARVNFEDDGRYEIVVYLTAVPRYFRKSKFDIRMTFGDEIADAVDALNADINGSSKIFMDTVCKSELSSAVLALYMSDWADRLSGREEVSEDMPWGRMTWDQFSYCMGRLRDKYSVEIAQLQAEGAL